MAGEAPKDPKDMADVLEGIARRIRSANAAAAPPVPVPEGGSFHVAAEGPAIGLDPWLGEVDVFSDATHVTVTAETRNADAAHVHVSVAQGRLHIGIGEAVRRELPLPAPVDEEHAYATFRNGVLDVVLPRRGAVRRGE